MKAARVYEILLPLPCLTNERAVRRRGSVRNTLMVLLALVMLAAPVVVCAQGNVGDEGGKSEASGGSSADAAVAAPIATGEIDLQADRLMVTQVSKHWRFQGGDNARWAEPGFDDSGWKVLEPLQNWSEQGWVAKNSMGWVRFRLRVPGGASSQAGSQANSLVMVMPSFGKAYQIFADGRMVGQAGSLPPAKPEVLAETARLFTIPVASPVAGAGAGAQAKDVVIAIRLWEDPRLAGIVQNSLYSPMYVGGARPVGVIFNLVKARDLLARGTDYTSAVISVIVGAAGMLLFLLTRRSYYGWFSLSMILGALTYPMDHAAKHFGWGYFDRVYAYAFLDLVVPWTYAIFILDALGLKKWRVMAWLVPMNLVAEAGPVMFILGGMTQVWADGIYVIFTTMPEAILAWLILRSWRRGDVFAKLIFFPNLLSFLISSTGNLGHFLVDLNVPHADALLTPNIALLTEPFRVTWSDVGNLGSTLGLLAVLVYEFARSSREEQRLKSALQTAHDIQQSLVPVDIPLLGGLHTEIVYLAAEEVGGDFCQVLPRVDGSILVVIGDVSGKGLQAAMLGTLAVGALRSMADEAIGPAEMLQRLNNVLLRTANSGFITCLCLNLTPAGEVVLANAGHLSPYLDGVEVDTEPGLPLGIVPDLHYRQSGFLLPPTARLTLMSDGVVEARSASGELYGFDRTCEISRHPAKEIAAEANRFGQEDDITVITLDWRGMALAS